MSPRIRDPRPVTLALRFVALHVRALHAANPAKALGWLETAMRLHDTGLSHLKADPLLDPLRNESRFQAVVRQLKFPD